MVAAWVTTEVLLSLRRGTSLSPNDVFASVVVKAVNNICFIALVSVPRSESCKIELCPEVSSSGFRRSLSELVSWRMLDHVHSLQAGLKLPLPQLYFIPVNIFVVSDDALSVLSFFWFRVACCVHSFLFQQCA